MRWPPVFRRVVVAAFVGTLISLDGRRVGDIAHRPGRTIFWFDLADPATYLAAERVDRLLPGVAWTPAVLPGPSPDRAVLREAHEQRAALLGLPLIWPGTWPEAVPRVMRAAAYAGECGRGGRFVLAAARLAYCGGFGLEDPETIAEAAAAAGVALRECLAAAADVARDAAIEAAGHRLAAAGVAQLPAVGAGRALFVGEERVGGAARAARG